MPRDEGNRGKRRADMNLHGADRPDTGQQPRRMQDAGGNRRDDQARENQRRPPTGTAPLDAPGGDDRLPRRQPDDRVAARRVEDERRASAVLYRSGSGLVRFTSSRHTMASNWPPIPKRLRWSITHLRVELDATAVLSPSWRAATR